MKNLDRRNKYCFGLGTIGRDMFYSFEANALLHFLSKKRKYDGEVFLGYVAWYGLGRAIIEGLRTDSLYIGPLRVSQWLAGISCVAAVAILVYQRFFVKHTPQDLLINRVAEAEKKETEE